jgi:hypothetical protein
MFFQAPQLRKMRFYMIFSVTSLLAVLSAPFCSSMETHTANNHSIYPLQMPITSSTLLYKDFDYSLSTDGVNLFCNHDKTTFGFIIPVPPGTYSLISAVPSLSDSYKASSRFFVHMRNADNNSDVITYVSEESGNLSKRPLLALNSIVKDLCAVDPNTIVVLAQSKEQETDHRFVIIELKENSFKKLVSFSAAHDSADESGKVFKYTEQGFSLKTPFNQNIPVLPVNYEKKEEVIGFHSGK